MKKSQFYPGLIRLFLLVNFCFTVFSFTGHFGLDSYEIYLNNKLILKHSVNQPLNLRILKLNEAKPEDQLNIFYKHCTTKGAGSDRTIVVKNEKGNIVKKWVFENTNGTDIKMSISVKELLNLEKANGNHDLTLHYTSREHPKGEMLSLVKFN